MENETIPVTLPRKCAQKQLPYENEMSGLYGLCDTSTNAYKRGVSFTMNIDIPKEYMRNHDKVIEILQSLEIDSLTLNTIISKLKAIDPTHNDDQYHSKMMESILGTITNCNSLDLTRGEEPQSQYMYTAAV